MIGTTHVKTHVRRRAETERHALADAKGRLIAFLLTGGEATRSLNA
jgi:hypothetical protein